MSEREESILEYTQRILEEEAVVSHKGGVGDAKSLGKAEMKNATELVKDRVWGGDERPVSIRFDSVAWRSIMRESFRSDDLETGGILIGEVVDEGDELLITVHRSCIKPRIREYARYSPDTEFLKERESYFGRENGWIYLGEWHRHPGAMNCLSQMDIDTAAEILRDEKRDLLVLPIATRSDDSIRLDVYMADLDSQGELRIRHLWSGADSRPYEEDDTMTKIYVDDRWVREFVNGEAREVTYEGRWNRGKSYVFIPLPGDHNALLKLVRSDGNMSIPADPSRITGILFENGTLSFYGIEEGETKEFFPVKVDPEEDVYSRNLGLLETTELRDKKIMIVGCGSLGSVMALELARAGVGNMHLMDPDILEPHNVSRHQCGLHELGRLKVDALRDRIMDICPSIRVQAHPIDVVEDQDNIDLTMDVAEECDLLICTTDTDSSRAFVNDLTLRLGVPSIQVGLHDRAQSGIVQVVFPDNGACFMCHRRSTLDIGAQRNDAVAYSDASDVRDVTIQPGLSSQIGLVAEVGVIRAIDLLCGGTEDSEAEGLPDLTLAYICKSESGSMGRPYLRFVHMNLEKADNCAVCGEPLEE